MSLSEQNSTNFQLNICRGEGCEQSGKFKCHHCSKSYCYLCFMCHRKYLIEQMKMLSEQMTVNRRQSIEEVVEFINRQAKDAQKEAEKLVNEAIERIRELGENIHEYVDARRLVKIRRVDECLETFLDDENLLNSNIEKNLCLPASTLLDFRRRYVSNMFDEILPLKTEIPKNSTEIFFDNYRLYKEMMQIRQRWNFFHAALTSVYFTSRKQISLDEILTFSEYRHDRVMENYLDEKSTEKENFDPKNEINKSSVNPSKKRVKPKGKRRRRNRRTSFSTLN